MAVAGTSARSPTLFHWCPMMTSTSRGLQGYSFTRKWEGSLTPHCWCSGHETAQPLMSRAHSLVPETQRLHEGQRHHGVLGAMTHSTEAISPQSRFPKHGPRPANSWSLGPGKELPSKSQHTPKFEKHRQGGGLCACFGGARQGCGSGGDLVGKTPDFMTKSASLFILH